MSIKIVTKKAFKLLHKHIKNKNDIYIFTLPRTGSTLLLEILNTDKNCKAASEPQAMNKHNRTVLEKYFNENFIKERYTDCSSEEQEQLFRYFSDLSAGKTWNSFYWSDFPKKEHSFRTNRTLFKTQKITYLFDDFLNHFDDYGIYLLRHPISHSLSRIRNKWTTYNQQYLQAEKIRETISYKAKIKAEAIIKNGSQLEKFVLSWCLENYVFFYLQKNNLLPEKLYPISFESIVNEPEKTMRTLCKKIELPFTQEMLKKIQIPSHGIVHSTNQTIQQIKNGENKQILSKWRNHISKTEEEKAYSILQEFDIHTYKYGNDLSEKMF